MEQFRRYVDELEQLAQGRKTLRPIEWQRKLAMCLDGEPREILRREENHSRLKEQGAYFTGANMAMRLAKVLDVGTDYEQVYLDPTCGAGDLLLAVAKKLPIANTFRGTLDHWGRCLAGCDISSDFVRLAKIRLALLASKRCRVRLSDESVVLDRTFPKIVEADFLSYSQPSHRTDVVIMNPPFGYTRAPDECEWARGRISAAAMFVERVIQDSQEGTRVVAILPDVLRSGSRYGRWRNMISTLSSIRGERPLGLFDRWADVDVYLLDLLKTGEQKEGRAGVSINARKLGGVGRRFAVHVGPVVPHRHEEVGPEVRYIHARSLPAWEEQKRIVEKRKFTGRLFEPPFVAVRRTSRPDGGKRAIATLVLGRGAVAVENHLMVLLPKDGTEDACRALIARLQSSKTDNWLNRRLRCRHLTTSVLAEMPWWYKP